MQYGNKRLFSSISVLNTIHLCTGPACTKECTVPLVPTRYYSHQLNVAAPRAVYSAVTCQVYDIANVKGIMSYSTKIEVPL